MLFENDYKFSRDKTGLQMFSDGGYYSECKKREGGRGRKERLSERAKEGGKSTEGDRENKGEGGKREREGEEESVRDRASEIRRSLDVRTGKRGKE